LAVALFIVSSFVAMAKQLRPRRALDNNNNPRQENKVGQA
jgi:hypothetical protein